MYALWRLTVDAGTMVNVVAEGHPASATTLATGVWVWKENDFEGTREGLVGATWFDGLRVHASQANVGSAVSIKDNPGCQVAALAREFGLFSESCHASRGYTATLPAAGEWYVLILFAIDGTWSGSVRLSSTQPLHGLQRALGPASYAGEETFNSTSVLVEAPLLPTVKAIMGASVDYDAANQVFGYFMGVSHTGTLNMSYQSPSATFGGSDFYLIERGAPGRHRFFIDFDVEASRFNKVWALAADIDFDEIGPVVRAGP